MTFGIILEWIAFAAALCTVFFYGRSKLQGALIGCCCALLFIAWGAVTAQHAVWLTNIIFLILHARNFRRARREEAAHA